MSEEVVKSGINNADKYQTGDLCMQLDNTFVVTERAHDYADSMNVIEDVSSTPSRIMVDMSATLIHNGHIRLLKRAKQFGHVIVALTTDEEIKTKKGYEPELTYKQRAEILSSIRYVDEVVPCRWLLDNAFLESHQIDYLVHGDDNSNDVHPEKMLIFPRTQGISSSLLRKRVISALDQIEKSRNAL